VFACLSVCVHVSQCVCCVWGVVCVERGHMHARTLCVCVVVIVCVVCVVCVVVCVWE
jgi:hypothetical protein